MNIHRHDSTAAESQASELLKNVLQADSEEDSSLRMSTAMLVDESAVSGDFSSDSSNSHSAPHYNYHGLATTQTQSEEHEPDGMSQKENVNASSRDALSSSSNHVQSAMHIQVSKAARVEKTDRLPSKSTKAISFHTPQAARPPVKPASTGRLLRPSAIVCKRDSSLDSFAGDSADPAQKLIASTKQFDIPVSELGRATSHSMMYSEHQGTILVDSTPTPGGSQSQSQPHSDSQPGHSDEYEMNPRQPDDDDEDDVMLPAVERASSESQHSSGYQSSEPTSSYRNMYARRYTPPPEPTQPADEATQPADESTQPADGTNRSIEPTQLVESVQFLPPNPDPRAMFSIPANTTGQARSLFSTLDENKKKRYGAVHAGQNSRMSDHSGPSGYTALDLRLDFEAAHVLPPRGITGFYQQSDNGAPQRQRRTVSQEKTEIIPDSEPPREGSSPSRQNQLNTNPAKRRRSGSDTESDPDVVPDSLDVAADSRRHILDTRSLRQEEEEEEEAEQEQDAKSVDLKGKGKARQTNPTPNKAAKARAQLVSSARKGGKKNSAPPAKKAKTRGLSPPVPSSVPHQDHPDVKPKLEKAESSASRSRTRGGNRRNYYESSDEEHGDDEGGERYNEAEPSTHKSKRGIKAESPAVQRQPKAVRTTVRRTRATSTNNSVASGATRVFALWRQDRFYYPGIIHSLVAAGRYKVDFDDHTTDVINLEDIRLCELRVGDAVYIPRSTRTVQVTDVSNFHKAGQISVDKNGSTQCLVSELKIDAKTVKANWTDRCVDEGSVVFGEKSVKVGVSPTPSRVSISSTGTSRRASGLFSEIAFCITHPQNEVKKQCSTTIKSNGGAVIDEWGDAFPVLKDKYSTTQFTLAADDLAPNTQKYKCVLLLADDAGQTPKYLLALALGIPCLRIDFVAHAVQESNMQDWMMYLLPAGHSGHLGCRVSQFVNLDWMDGNIGNIKGDPVRFKAFEDQRVLYFSAKVFEKEHVNRMVPNIILAMGAEEVEVIDKIKQKNHDVLHYDFVVVDENARWRVAHSLGFKCVVPWEWVKNSLISRSRLPTPPVPAN